MKIKVFQIVSERDKRSVKFAGLEEMKKYQGSDKVNAALYEEVFDGDVDRDTLEGVYELLNTNHPPLYRGHSMSVSDVVKTEDGFFYCDRYGFKKIDFDESFATKPKDLLRIVFVEPGKPAYAAEIENSLRAEQRAVGGMIEVVSNGDGTLIVCNEEGKLIGLPANRRIAGGADILVGNFFVIGEEMATARQFLFIARCRNMKAQQIFARSNQIQKAISEQGFEARRMDKGEIKRLLALYFDASMYGEQMPDSDGEQFFDIVSAEKER